MPNAGFDELSDCPNNTGQIVLAKPWVSGTTATPNIYNECSTEVLMAVPNAGRYLFSFQEPRSGDGYAHIGVYNNNNFISGSTGNSEYIEVELLQPMQKGGDYYLEFYVNPDFSNGYTGAIGMALSDTFYFETLTAFESLSLNPIIDNGNQIIKDTLNWTRISGCYTAIGGERFAIIGNFKDTEGTTVEYESFTTPFVNFFYIEDVLIRPYDPLPDTLLLCDGMSEEFNAEILEASYLWSTGETDPIITVTKSGNYIVEAFLQSCVLRDTMLVISTNEIADLPTDTIVCGGEPFNLISPLPGDFLWSDGSQQNDLTVLGTGIYLLTVTNECGDFVFTSNVEVEDCACNAYIPNAFSPNDDGVNDFLEIFFDCDYEYQISVFEVFDRWGNQVYSILDGSSVMWDGKFRKQSVQNGAYIWVLEYDVVQNEKIETRNEKGIVTILR